MTGLLLLHELLDAPPERGLGLFETNLGRLDNKGLGNLAGAVVGDGNDGAVGDGGVVEEAGLEFGGGNL